MAMAMAMAMAMGYGDMKASDRFVSVRFVCGPVVSVALYRLAAMISMCKHPVSSYLHQPRVKID